MPLYWIFIIIVTTIAICSVFLDRKLYANGKLNKKGNLRNFIIAFCIVMIITISIIIKIAL